MSSTALHAADQSPVPADTAGAGGGWQVAGLPGALCVAALLVISVFEIVSRYGFNAPTFWATEISTYVGVAAVFLSLAYAEVRGEHVRVEAFLEQLPEARRAPILRLANWLGVVFIAFCTVEMTRYLAADYTAGTRNWGLMSTLLWIPQVPVVLGLAGFTAILTWRASDGAGRQAAAALIVTGAVVAGYYAGRTGLMVAGHMVPWSLLIVTGAATVSAAITTGWRSGALLVGVLAVACAAMMLAASGGQTGAAIVILIFVFLFLAMGMQVAVALGLVGALGLIFLPPIPQTVVVAERVWNGVNSFTYTAVPMFVLMGSLLMRAGISRSLFDGLVVWMGRIPGGLAQATLTASGLFAALSGSSIATAATIGKAAGQEMLDRGYKPSLALGSIAGGGTLGILIPPSVPMIIFAAMVGVSVTKLFVAGIIPGLLVLVSMMAAVWIWCLLKPEAGHTGRAYSLAEKARAFVQFGPFLGLIVIVIASLYFGIVTATEAGALGAALALILAGFSGKLSLDMIRGALLETAALTGGILFIVIGAGMLSWLVDYLRIATMLVEAVEGSGLSIVSILLMLMVVYLILGMFIDPISMMLMTVTITYPIVVHAGYDALWFGIALMMMIEVGLITPPVGIILFVLRGLFPQASFREISLGSLVFVGVILANVILIAVFPQIVGWLPSLMR
ncbi:TRAP transporter large permease subunit [Phaeobacter gallaeciensis]|jgi:tripartite ATP-independent transporter DctM subunit|uniref:TRAP transporter large permease subunit n=1 Tax=Phaeobacter gallaeciensis TaxID=60890 RepID=A0ABD4XDT4_9RHOB|nr:TRAP transporter large permease subunit [Phaeobacter gallaeciensis]MDE4142242.1 TRAP transporter large permease subunit [Phaeobacter gallaeciensis]MDE4146562.1 TRAP transporter large permease subunit [Phaeobacter gallaeciensis]MDE4150635.1 TRAP transporter large permease subunit [Phaeobacter gallaeciensis]MDE4154814.1 TRAP transporter large permease subunit [Phaeobacter gallaeciensis]MDE4159296.1 TRAP transporter large permease subunit [Phaeobacter gallaeciensis]